MDDLSARIQQIETTIQEVYRSRKIILPDGSPFELKHEVNPDEGIMLRDLVASTGGSTTLEIGMGTGLSGLHICWGLLLGGGEAATKHHLAIDPFQAGDFWKHAGVALRDQAGCADMFDWSGDRDDVHLPKLLSEGKQFDFALIDGDHRFEAAMLDFYYVDKMLRVGGLCAIDDTDWPSVWRVVQFAIKHRHYEWVDAVPVELGPITRPWGWRLRRRRYEVFKRQGWPVWEAFRRKPYQHVVLRKVAEDDRPEYFWHSLEGIGH